MNTAIRSTYINNLELDKFIIESIIQDGEGMLIIVTSFPHFFYIFLYPYLSKSAVNNQGIIPVGKILQ